MSHYKPYPEYKESGIEWIGKMPGHWDMKRLRHIANFKNSNVDKKSYDDQESVKLCNYTDVYYNEIITPDMDFMVATASESEIESFSLKKGDVIITKDSEDPKDIGIPSLVLEDLDDVVCGYHLTVINTYEPNMSEFVYRLIQAHSTKAHFFVESPGITRYGLDQDAIGDIPVCVPPEEERLSIINRINWEVNRIDTLITKKTRFIELIKEKILAIAMNEQMHGKDKFVRLGRLVQVISRPVKIVKEKEYIALGLYNRGRGLFHKPATLGKDIGDSNFFYVEEDDLIISGQFAWEGAVTMASKSEEGCVVSHRYPILRGDTINTEYLYALLMTHFGDFLLNESSRGAAGRNRPLNINLLLNEKIRLPSTEAQMQIKKLTNLKRVIDNKIRGFNSEVQHMKFRFLQMISALPGME